MGWGEAEGMQGKVNMVSPTFYWLCDAQHIT